MSIPLWVLLGFAFWTLLVLFGTVGVYRWSRILTGRAAISAFPPDQPHGSDWYRRAMRAHANCIENLPVYGAIVLVLVATGAAGRAFDVPAVIMLAARVGQTVTHITFEQTDRVVAFVFSFYFVQALCMFWMIGALAVRFW
jgi:uncharacterized MAPEG superfamily protein